MYQSYHFLFKKSIILLAAVCLLLPQLVGAQVPGDDRYSEQKDFWNLVNLEKAWDFTTGSPAVVVAVVDTGVDIWHPDLAGNIWVNPYEIANNGVDDDDNGYVDDVSGWNFIENNNNVRPDVLEVADDPEAIRHGTVVAGLIGEIGNNNKDGAGVNWRVSIMPIRAINSQGSGSMVDVAKAVDYAVDNGAMVISLSFVSDINDDNLRQSLIRAYDKGVVVVAAAGNDAMLIDNQSYLFPVCFDQDSDKNWILGVGSVHPSGKLSYFSNFGACVDLYAPGDNIFSTERYAPQFGYNQEFGGPWRGTSFSTPIVAGAAALIKSLHPEWKAEKINQILLDTATVFFLDKAGAMPAKIINVGAAVELAAQTNTPEPEFSYYYYFTKNEIRRRDRILRDQGMFAKISDAKVVSLSSKVNFSGTTDLAVLFKRGKYYFVRYYKDNGVWWKEFAVNTEKIGKSVAQPQKISWSGTGVKVASVFQKKQVIAVYGRDGARAGKSVISSVK